LDNATAHDMNALLEFAPVPLQARPLLYHKAILVISSAPHGSYTVADTHTDRGSGILSFGAGDWGSSVDLLLHPPTNSFDNKPPSMCAGSHAFDVEQLTVPNEEPKAEIHHVSLNRRGDSIQVPHGYWHAVRSTGFRICIGYFQYTKDRS
jgi:hypothetical protein